MKIHTLNAMVRGGRLILDEPTDLPEGQVIELVPADPFTHLDAEDAVFVEDRALLDASIETAWKDIRAGGMTISVEDALDIIRAKS